MKQKPSNFLRPLSTSLIIIILFLVSGLLFFRASLYGAWFLLLLGAVGFLVALLVLALPRSNDSFVLAFLIIVLLSGMAAASIHGFLVGNPGILYSLPASPVFRTFWALSSTEYEFALIVSVVIGIVIALALFGLIALAQVFWLALVDTRRDQRESPAWTSWFQELMGWVVFLILVLGVYLVGMAFFLIMESELSLARVNANYAFFPIILVPLVVVALTAVIRFLSIWRGMREPSTRVVFEEDITDKSTAPILGARLHLNYDYLPADALGDLLASVRQEADSVMMNTAEGITMSLIKHMQLADSSWQSFKEEVYRSMTLEVRSASTGASVTIILVIAVSASTMVVANALFDHKGVIKEFITPLDSYPFALQIHGVFERLSSKFAPASGPRNQVDAATNALNMSTRMDPTGKVISSGSKDSTRETLRGFADSEQTRKRL